MQKFTFFFFIGLPLFFSACSISNSNFTKKKYTSLRKIEWEADQPSADSPAPEKTVQSTDPLSVPQHAGSELHSGFPIEDDQVISIRKELISEDQQSLESILPTEELFVDESEPIIRRFHDLRDSTKKRMGTGGKMTLLFLALGLVAGLTILACTLTFYGSSSVGSTVIVGIIGLFIGAYIFYMMLEESKNMKSNNRRKFWTTTGIIAGVILAISSVFIDWGYLF